MEFIEIFLSILTVFGGYCILDMIKFALLYPRSVRKRIRAAVILEDLAGLPGIYEYAKYLRRENKISGERLIILVNDDIIKSAEDFSDIHSFGDVFQYAEILEVGENDGILNGRQESCDD